MSVPKPPDLLLLSQSLPLSKNKMSVPKRPPKSDLKQRVITCLNKLSDRDTLALATTELDSIALTLTHDSFSPFLTCLSTTDSSQKSPVRKQCVRLLGILSTAHGDSLSPHLSKMLSTILRRLKDPDSSVRSASVDAISSMASRITKPPFSTFIKPLVDAILVDQDYNVQIGSALCLSAAIDASPDPQPQHLKTLIPKFCKLLKTNCFKPKPALLTLIGTLVTANAASHPNALSFLVPCLVEFTSTEDWATRKAAADTLGRLAVVERDHLKEFKSSCLASLETRRFDKVKIVRDTMNRALELWKEVPGLSEEVSPLSQSKSSLKDGGYGRFAPTGYNGSHDIEFETSQSKKTISTCRTPSSDRSDAITTQKRSPLKSNHSKPSVAMFHKVDLKKPSNWNIDIATPPPPFSKMVCEEDIRNKNSVVPDSAESESCTSVNREIESVVFNKTLDEKLHNFGGSRFRSRVVPFHGNDNRELDVAEVKDIENVYGNHKEVENLDLIRKQLVQIENQQSSLLDLLQRFIGSSKSGINSLETRVNGLEKALDAISYDLALSTGKISNPDSARNSCCMLPGAEFLSPKYWRKTEGQYSTPRISYSGRNMPDKNVNGEMFKVDSPRGLQQSGVGSADLEDRNSRGSSELLSNKTPKRIIKEDAELVEVCNAVAVDGSSFANRIQQQI